MMWEKGNDDTICTFLNSTNRKPRPLSRVLRRWRVRIVPSTKEEYRKLNMYWELGIVGVIMKNRMVFDLCDETIKCLRIDSKLATEAIWAIKPPVI
jgi:hypothetical protein